MPRHGIILELLGDKALISTHKRGVCGDCPDRPTCALETAMAEDLPEKVLARNPVRAIPGDLVEFDLPEGAELKLSFLVWVVPVIGIVAGGLAGPSLLAALLPDRDLAAMAGAALGLVLSLLPVIRADRRLRRDPRITPEIKRILHPADCREGTQRIMPPESPSW
jgi:sigma-E factor negative regulatory protein RseC